MFFRKRAPKAVRSTAEIARSVFGDSADAIAPMRCETAEKYPFLACFGTQAESDFFVWGTCGTLEFECAFPLKIYSSQREYDRRSYGFLGSCITLMRPAFEMRSVYACTGKPFRAPEGAGWVLNEPCRGLSVWSMDQILSRAEEEILRQLIDWIEGHVYAMDASRYAIFIRDSRAHLVFRDPELCDLQSQLQLLKEAFSEL